MAAFDKFEITQHPAYRFIGKSIYIGNKGTPPASRLRFQALCDFLWEQSGWIFEALDELNEYATDEVHNAVLIHWEKYDEKNQLFGYTIGRFMKADTPVTDDFDYIDVPEGYIAKGFVKKEDVEIKRGNALAKFELMMEEELKLHDQFEMVFMMAEVYPVPDENGDTYVGLYELLKLKKPAKKLFRKKEKAK